MIKVEFTKEQIYKIQVVFGMKRSKLGDLAARAEKILPPDNLVRQEIRDDTEIIEILHRALKEADQ